MITKHSKVTYMTDKRLIPPGTPNARTRNPDLTIIRLSEVTDMTGLSRTTIYRRIKEDPEFPKPLKLGKTGVRNAPIGFYQNEVQRWLGKLRDKESQDGC